jgi:hypothetical protein
MFFGWVSVPPVDPVLRLVEPYNTNPNTPAKIISRAKFSGSACRGACFFFPFNVFAMMMSC